MSHTEDDLNSINNSINNSITSNISYTDHHSMVIDVLNTCIKNIVPHNHNYNIYINEKPQGTESIMDTDGDLDDTPIIHETSVNSNNLNSSINSLLNNIIGDINLIPTTHLVNGETEEHLIQSTNSGRIPNTYEILISDRSINQTNSNNIESSPNTTDLDEPDGSNEPDESNDEN